MAIFNSYVKLPEGIVCSFLLHKPNSSPNDVRQLSYRKQGPQLFTCGGDYVIPPNSADPVKSLNPMNFHILLPLKHTAFSFIWGFPEMGGPENSCFISWTIHENPIYKWMI